LQLKEYICAAAGWRVNPIFWLFHPYFFCWYFCYFPFLSRYLLIWVTYNLW
jgi:hypothetical protein